MRVETALEDGDVELVVRVCVYAEIFDFVERDRLVFGRGSIGRCVPLETVVSAKMFLLIDRRYAYLGIASECADLDFAGRHSPVGVDLRDCQRRHVWAHAEDLPRQQGTGR